MKAFGLKAGVNYIDRGYGHVNGVDAGKITSIEVYSESPGNVTVSRKIKGFAKVQTLATITVANDGYGVATGVGKNIAYGDMIEVSGVPVEGNNKYAVTCFCE